MKFKAKFLRKAAENKYCCQCGRCGGIGRYDRGTCFECKGNGFTNKSKQPSGNKFDLAVTYENGSTNRVTIYASTKEIAVSLVERQLKIKGWNGTVN
jgi:DnaJ-class molecular chaperone